MQIPTTFQTAGPFNIGAGEIVSLSGLRLPPLHGRSFAVAADSEGFR